MREQDEKMKQMKPLPTLQPIYVAPMIEMPKSV